eukprot:1156104-Pelagomonas_calceolata.AAC.2
MMPCLCLVLELDLRQPLFVQMLKVAYLLVVFSPDFKPRSLRKISLPRCLQEIYQSNEDNISMPGQGCVAQFLQEKIDPDKAPSQQDTPKAQSIILLDHMICAAKRHLANRNGSSLNHVRSSKSNWQRPSAEWIQPESGLDHECLVATLRGVLVYRMTKSGRFQHHDEANVQMQCAQMIPKIPKDHAAAAAARAEEELCNAHVSHQFRRGKYSLGLRPTG